MFMHSVYIFNAEILKHFQSKDTEQIHKSCSLIANINENSPYLQA